MNRLDKGRDEISVVLLLLPEAAAVAHPLSWVASLFWRIFVGFFILFYFIFNLEPKSLQKYMR